MFAYISNLSFFISHCKIDEKIHQEKDEKVKFSNIINSFIIFKQLDEPVKLQKKRKVKEGGISDSIVYLKDKKTNLCFASIYSFSHGFANKVDSLHMFLVLQKLKNFL